MPLTENIHLLTPEFALAGLALLVFVVDLFLPEHRKTDPLVFIASRAPGPLKRHFRRSIFLGNDNTGAPSLYD